MIQISKIATKIEATLSPGEMKLELLGPFITSYVCLIHEGREVEFEVLSLEWLAELRRFLSFDMYPPGEYRTNLTVGGEEFYARLLANGSVSLSVYDRPSKTRLELPFTANDLAALINVIYDQIVQEFINQSSSPTPIEADRKKTLTVLSAWQSRVTRTSRPGM